MPRTDNLPPISFVRELSTSGKSLMEHLTVSRLQDKPRDQTPSFSEQLRAQPDGSNREIKRPVADDRKSVSPDVHRMPPERTGRSQSQTQANDRSISPESTHTPLRGEPRGQVLSEKSHSEGQAEKNRDQRVPSSDPEDKAFVSKQTLSERSDQNEVPDTKQSKVEPSEKNSSSSEIPSGLGKYVSESFGDVEIPDENEASEQLPDVTSEQAQVPPTGLSNALQMRSENDLSVSEVSSEADTAVIDQPGEDFSPNVKQQDSEEAELSLSVETVATQVSSSELVQSPEASESGGVQKLPSDKLSEAESQAEDAQAVQESEQSLLQLSTDSHPENNAKSGSEQTEQVVQENPSAEADENEQVPAEQPLPNHQSAQAFAERVQQPSEPSSENSGQEETDSEDSLQRTTQASVNSITEQQGVAEVDLDEPKTATVDRKTDKDSPVTDSGSSKEATVFSKNIQQSVQATPGQDSLLKASDGITGSASKPGSDKRLSPGLDPVLTIKTGKGKTGEGAEGQKTVQSESMNGISSSSVSSSSDVSRTAPSRPVLDITKSDVSQKIASFIQQAGESGKALRIRLNPPELGTLQIEVGRFQGQTVARFEVDSQTVRALIHEQLHLLRDSLQQQGLRVDRFEVEVNESLSREFTSDHSAEQGAEEHQHQRQHAEQAETAIETPAQQEEELAPSAPAVSVSGIDVRI